MKYAISAKDKAFEQQRVKYRQRIRELEMTIEKQAKTELSLRQQLQETEGKIRDQEDWIRRLLEYMDITPEEFRAKMKAEISIGNMFDVMKSFGRS